jgi:hypothetical protein
LDLKLIRWDVDAPAPTPGLLKTQAANEAHV